MWMADAGQIDSLPPQWEHDPIMRDKHGNTVAMIIADNYGVNNLPD